MEKTTNALTNILKKTKPDSIGEYVKANAEDVFTQENPFSTYMRECVREKGLRFQEIFLRADLSEGYGYKLISGEKHTRQRDTILKLCLGAGFSLQETQRALKIYGMSPLYARFPRDAVFFLLSVPKFMKFPRLTVSLPGTDSLSCAVPKKCRMTEAESTICPLQKVDTAVMYEQVNRIENLQAEIFTLHIDKIKKEYTR